MAVGDRDVSLEPLSIENDVCFPKHGTLPEIFTTIFALDATSEKDEDLEGQWPSFHQVDIFLDFYRLKLMNMVRIETLVPVLEETNRHDGVLIEVVAELGF